MASERPLPGGHETILFVDDEPMIINMGEALLKPLGYNVLTALSGRQAVDIFKKRKAHIDLVILDLTMPEMSGREVMEKLLEIDSGCRIIISTGFDEDMEAKELQEKARAVCRKPYSIFDLSETIRTVLDNT